MFVDMQRAAALDRSFKSMQEQIFAHALDQESLELRKPVGVASQETVVCTGRQTPHSPACALLIYSFIPGRICCDADGKLNKASVLLEGGREDGGHRVQLKLTDLPSYALFPGQYVAVEGVNSSGNRMVARKLCDGVPRPLPTSHNDTLLSSPMNAAPFRMMVASGPYCCSDNLEYEPLRDILHRATKIDPVEVLILCGPFVDIAHEAVAKGITEEVSLDGTLEVRSCAHAVAPNSADHLTGNGIVGGGLQHLVQYQDFRFD